MGRGGERETYNEQSLCSTQSGVFSPSIRHAKLVEDSCEGLEKSRHGLDRNDLSDHQVGEEVYLVTGSAWAVGNRVWTYAETNVPPCQPVEIALETLPKIFED